MARADLLINLVRAGSRGDQALFKRTVEALIAEERAKEHNILADRLSANMQSNGPRAVNGLDILNDRVGNLLFETTPQRKMDDLLLPNLVRNTCNDLIEEQHRSDLLRSYNLEPRNRVLLAGPPGNGKTTLAEALADALMVPFFIVRYEGVIGTYLGETAVRLQRLFDYVRTHRCVLFFDEFDTLGKERGDVHETGEIKRVVSALLLQIDALPSHVVVVTATNHPELLDRAVWRRFQLRLLLPPPNQRQLTEWFHRFEKNHNQSLCYTPAALARKLRGLSFGEVEDFSADILRRYILSLPQGDMKQIVKQCLSQWQARFSVSAMEE